MIFEQLFDKKSSTYTYLIASNKGREALIIDPVLDNVEEYINLLNNLNLNLVKVIDTHIHADHVTGASKLKSQTNCTIIMGDKTPADAVEIKVKDEEIIKLDEIEIKALHTPGHTSDSFSFMMNNYLSTSETNPAWNHDAFSIENYRGRIVDAMLSVHPFLNDPNPMSTFPPASLNGMSLREIFDDFSWNGLKETAEFIGLDQPVKNRIEFVTGEINRTYSRSL